jgi:hypothetical protein
MLNKIIKQDKFGAQMNLLFQAKQFHGSLFGGIISIIINIISIIIAIYFFSELYYR